MRVGAPSTPSAAQSTIARAAIAAFSGTPRVVRYWDDNRRCCVDIVSCADSPWDGATSYATVGVFATPLVFEGRELDVRTELVGACYSPTDDYAGCLATAAFFVVNSGVFVAPGVILPNDVAMHHASKTKAHMLFVPPLLWDERLKTIDVEKQRVAWLQAVPISQTELEVALRDGVPALEAEFERQQVDVFDIARPSV